MRVLENFEASNTGIISFELYSANKFALSKSKRESSEIKKVIESELQKMSYIDSSYSSVFKFLSQVYLIAKNEDSGCNKRYNVAPLTKMTPCFITLDQSMFKNLNNSSPIKLIDLIKIAEKLCPNKESGHSFKTDGTQVII